MGAIFSRRKKKSSTEDVLTELQAKIESLEESKKIDVEKQKYLIGSLILYSILIYIGVALLFYFYCVPATLMGSIQYASPLAAFPLLVWLIKRFLHWYFVKRISKNELALEQLKKKKHKILDEVMETETYKKAKEILEKFDPERLHDSKFTPPTPVSSPEGQELRHRNVQSEGLRMTSSAPTTPTRDPQQRQQMVRPQVARPNTAQRNGGQVPQAAVGMPSIRPALPRPILPRERSAVDKLVDYLLGDGPQNRYALICLKCASHNGMALKEEFEYISFRCCYCNTLNPARKQRPLAPREEICPPREEICPPRQEICPPRQEICPPITGKTKIEVTEQSEPSISETSETLREEKNVKPTEEEPETEKTQ